MNFFTKQIKQLYRLSKETHGYQKWKMWGRGEISRLRITYTQYYLQNNPQGPTVGHKEPYSTILNNLLRAGGEGDDRGWDGWMVSLTQWTWVWTSSRSWWWTGRPGALQSMGSQRVGHDWATELMRNEPEKNVYTSTYKLIRLLYNKRKGGFPDGASG